MSNSDDIVDRLTDHDYSYCTDAELGESCDFCDGIDLHQQAADEIIRLHAEVERLTAENQEFRDQFADADEIAALIKQHGGDLDAIPGWTKQTWPDWHALADQLAEALRDESRNGPLRGGAIAALAAYEAAHKETT